MQEFISLLHSDDLRLAHRKSPKVFCRASPLNFLTLVSWFLASPCACVQTELDNFFATLRERSQLLRTVSAQALSQARKGLLPSVFTALNAHLVRLVESQFAQPLWHGLRVVAADVVVQKAPFWGNTGAAIPPSRIRDFWFGTMEWRQAC